MSKGSRNRTSDFPAYRRNFDRIDWGRKPSRAAIDKLVQAIMDFEDDPDPVYEIKDHHKHLGTHLVLDMPPGQFQLRDPKTSEVLLTVKNVGKAKP